MITKLLPYIIVVLTSCSPNFYVKKAERALKKAEQLGVTVKPDTIYITREIITPEYKYDTLIKQVDFRDTIRITDTRVETKIKINYLTKEVYIENKVKPDTLKIEVPITVTKEIHSGYSLWDLLIIVAIALLVIIAVWKFKN